MITRYWNKPQRNSTPFYLIIMTLKLDISTFSLIIVTFKFEIMTSFCAFICSFMVQMDFHTQEMLNTEQNCAMKSKKLNF